MSSRIVIILLLSILQFSCSRHSVSKSSITVDEVAIKEMKMYVKTLADDSMEGRETGTPGEKKAADFIQSRMVMLGVGPGIENGYFQDFERRIRANPHATTDSPEDELVSVRNVVGKINNDRNGYIVIGAHYDHLGYGGEGSLHTGEKAIHNGADDNASGIAILLELGKRIANNKIREEHNILLVAFSGEEKGLWGSNYYVDNSGVKPADISFMLNMDMVGRLNDEKKLAVNGVGTAPDFDKALTNANVHSLNLVTSESGVGPSDHTSFYLEDVPVLHFFTGQHKDYHKPSDDPELLNYTGMDQIADLLYNLIIDLDHKEDLAFTKTKDESTQAPEFKVTLGVIPDYLYDGKGMRIDGVKEGRPAANAGMIKGDIVIKMGDLEIVDMMSYMKGLASFEKGSTIDVVIERKGKRLPLKVTF